MKKIHIVFLIALIFVASSCGNKVSVNRSEICYYVVDERYDGHTTAYSETLGLLRDSLDAQLDVVVGSAARNLTSYRPESPLSNWESDAILDMARQYSGRSVDASVMNMGGIRCDLVAGDITMRRVFELMPFENKLVYVSMLGSDIDSLCQVFAACHGQGVGGMSMVLRGGRATDICIGGQPLDAARTYVVATSDYLAGGKDQMTPFLRGEVVATDITLRDLFLAYIKRSTDAGQPIDAQLDGRITYYDGE